MDGLSICNHTFVDTHDDDTDVVVDEETYETYYGLRHPTLDMLLRSYLHVWTIQGTHVRFVSYTEHTEKCKTDTITKWSSDTFYRWNQKEEQNYRLTLSRFEVFLSHVCDLPAVTTTPRSSPPRFLLTPYTGCVVVEGMRK